MCCSPLFKNPNSMEEKKRKTVTDGEMIAEAKKCFSDAGYWCRLNASQASPERYDLHITRNGVMLGAVACPDMKDVPEEERFAEKCRIAQELREDLQSIVTEEGSAYPMIAVVWDGDGKELERIISAFADLYRMLSQNKEYFFVVFRK